MKENNKYNNEERDYEQDIFYIMENKRDEVFINNQIKILENKNIDLSILIEEKTKNSLVISSVYYNLTEVSIYLIDYFRNKFNSSTKFLDYLNLRNIKGYDALLYSAYRGNYTIFKKLLDNGANLNTNNITGLNLLHLATQENRINIITALMEKYIFDINKQDNHGNTALHWAVYFNNQQCIDYLIHYNININIMDNNNCTAMDIAVKRENENLIVKIKNSLTIQYLDSENKQNIKQYFSFLELIQINIIKYLYIPFLIILILSELYNQKLIAVIIDKPKINFTFIILFTIQIFLYYLLTKSESEKKEINPKESLFSLLNKDYDMNNVCPWCAKNKTNESSHCAYCKKCVEFQVFHNNLLNNCISKNNFILYLFYLTVLAIVFISKSLVAIYCIKISELSIIRDNKYTFYMDVLISFSFCILCIYRLIKKFKQFKLSKSEEEVWEHKGQNNQFFPEIDNRIIMN